MTPCSASSSPTTSTGCYPTLPEGELAKVRASVVSAAALAEVAAELELGDALSARQGRGSVRRTGEAVHPRRRARGGDRRGVPRGRLGRGASDWSSTCSATGSVRPAKARAARTTRRGSRSWWPGISPSCRATGSRDEGPDHAKRFFAEVRVAGQVRGEGEGRSKKQAEAAAARSAWEALRNELSASGEAQTVTDGSGTVETKADA